MANEKTKQPQILIQIPLAGILFFFDIADGAFYAYSKKLKRVIPINPTGENREKIIRAAWSQGHDIRR